MTRIIQQNLALGMKVKILENGKVVDEAIIRRIGAGGCPLREEVEVQSLRLHPEKTAELAFICHNNPNKEGWRVLFEDPMTGERCYSQRAPVYVLEPK